MKNCFKVTWKRLGITDKKVIGRLNHRVNSVLHGSYTNLNDTFNPTE